MYTNIDNHKARRTQKTVCVYLTDPRHYVGILCLLLSGDVHPNPGSTGVRYKYPCGRCFKPVNRHKDRRGRGIQCDLCGTSLPLHWNVSANILHCDIAELEFVCNFCALPTLNYSFFNEPDGLNYNQ